jgi:long-chain acyl-CoA synthetase
LSWGEWNAEADRLAYALRRRGIGPGDIVVVRTRIRREWPVIRTTLGKLGCRLLGLNWRFTPVEMGHVLADSGAVAIVCDDADPAAIAASWVALPIKVAISIDTPSPGFSFYADLAAEPPGEPIFAQADPRLIIYTSGTTGLPKGVEMGKIRPGHEEKLRAYNRSMAEARAQIPGDIVLVTMPMHHGAGPALIAQSIRTGNTMILLRRYDAEQALALIQRHKVSYWNGVPTMYARMAALPADVLARYDVTSIRSLSVGAAPITDELKGWIQGYFGACLHEGYGTTETGMMTTISPDMHRLKPGSSGRPFAGVDLSIRDVSGAECQLGEEGEIWARTPVTISGYLNAAALGAETLDARGFFRTGDVGRLDEDGYLYITDRAKDMIIAGGVNIYPAEVEAVLLRHPAVQDAAVIGIPDDEYGEAVKAYCERKAGAVTSEAELIAYARGQLASYKVPRAIEFVAELPRNGMGKLLKRVLRAPYWKDRERKL